MSESLAVIILTFNSAEVIERTVRAAQEVGGTVLCVDSFSTDATQQILRGMGCRVYERTFKHYSDQRNWAIAQLGARYTWQLHLDADEILDDTAIEAVRAAVRSPGESAGFLLRRRTYFLGRPLHHGGVNSSHMRLFRSGQGACEDRMYDQHFVCRGPVGKLAGWMHDVNAGSLSEWTARHNRWSDMEVGELLRPSTRAGDVLEPRLSGDVRERRRAYKGAYYRAPSYLRAWLYFLYRYVLQAGFLDGRPGFLYAFLQTLWFRMLVDAKLGEARTR